MTDKVRNVVKVSGRVQGVFFRESCRRKAEQLGISGTAANLYDGTVEVVVEGESEAVEKMVAWCREGPPDARVTGIDIRNESPEGLSGFLTN
ncbi:MAG: acylphosphatase [Actinomycetota bacterium]